MVEASKNSFNRLGAFQEAWEKREGLQTGDWVQEVSTTYFNCDIGLVGAADLLGCQAAELQAALVLGSLDEADLQLVSDYNPPITSWFFLAECPPGGLKQVLEAIEKRPSHTAAAEAAQQALREVAGPSIAESMAELDSATFTHLHKKATEHGTLTEKGRKALRSFASYLKRGKPLTPKQVAYAQGLLDQMAQLGVIDKNSVDGDHDMMVRVLKAIGR